MAALDRFYCIAQAQLTLKAWNRLYIMIHAREEGSGSLVECLTRDQGVVGWSLTGGTALCP